ncbi:MAG: MBL fold metallo-hydrolase [Erysipelotrichaceae bacterium]|nr:MBL fold metallo-hydrolase [Erysipelotrichaceae bacterium]
MKYYDFSSKHHIMLRNKDGSLLPMDEPYFESHKVTEHTWDIFSAGDHSYLIEGKEMGMLIDSGYGAGNIREYCEKLIGKSVPWIANTHEHFDHTANNGYFDLAFMSEIAAKTASIPYASFEGIEFRRDYPIQFVKHGDIIGPEDRKLRVFQLTDHTPGGMVYLDETERILFSGDEIWENKLLRNDIRVYGRQMLEIAKYRDCFDIMCAGEKVFEGSVFDRQIANIIKAFAGEKGEPFVPGARKKPENESDVIIYDRQFPHPGDKAGNIWGNPEPDRSRFIVITTDGVSLGFAPFR